MWIPQKKKNYKAPSRPNSVKKTAATTPLSASCLCIDSIVTSTQGEINDTIIQFYKNLFDEIVTWQPILDGLEFHV